ncbi:hypothetical protein SI65_07984 [Aspergillus cristatus]|uniref:Protein kinase domain-containing protein n=1 Tax=Aspergillus cristatus TaxID=573508 RepID=A0A1E3B6A4_ASPCR|nr:hypothetical protein SI65_07984 [Aspergillus cristatus]
MDPASFGLAVFSALDLCIKYGGELIKICREYRRFEEEIDEIVLVVEGLWVKTEVQLDSLRVLWNTLHETLQPHYFDALQRLERKTLAAVQTIQHVKELAAPDASTLRKVKAIYIKRHLKEAVADLEDWQRRFDPSWYLITRIASPVIDKQLRDGLPGHNSSTIRLKQIREAIKEVSSIGSSHAGSVFMNTSHIVGSAHEIPGTNTTIASYGNDARTVLLDRTDYGPLIEAMTAKTYVRDLARLLLNVEPMTFGLLKCEGVIELPDENNKSQFQFILEVPKGLSSPRTLRSILAEAPRCSLSHRIQLAKQLARSVMFVHTSGFVHKNIRPETILVFADGSNRLGPSFLSGFERIRPSGAATEKSGDLVWQKNFYRHPTRQGLWPEDYYSMQHDIYSLGVCLLELALWRSFVQYDGDTAVPCSELDITAAISDKDPRRGAFAIKKKLVAMAEHRLPSSMGDRYTDLTVACLTCLDNGESNTFGYDVKDEDGIVVGVRYIEKVLLQIEEICI